MNLVNPGIQLLQHPLVCAVLTFLMAAGSVRAQLVLSGNENKIDLVTGAQRLIPNAPPDTVTLLDFATFPPAVTHLTNISNTVIGPPSNVAIHPRGRMGVVASSIRLPTPTSQHWVPDNRIYILDLAPRPPVVADIVTVESQPSGLCFSADGQRLLVANRAAGTVSVFAVDGLSLRQVQLVRVCEPAESVSDVAISPDGRLALASVQKGGYMAVLRFDGHEWVVSRRKISVSGQPYRCLITPDGQLGLVAGLGFGNGVDIDELSVIDLRAREPRTIDHVPLGTVPESIELSPDGRLLAAVVMDGCSLAPEDPLHRDKAGLVILERQGRTFVRRQRLDIAPIPENAVFTGDGRHLVVQSHPERSLAIYSVHGSRVRDTGLRIAVPGMPSSMCAGPRPEPGRRR